MREALSIIAELRDSARLRRFLETGTDRQWVLLVIVIVSLTSPTAGEIVPPTRSDLPRGLNQLGNTCYLNSLLQVYVTVLLCSFIL
jgi:ubiquitin carboxyl-terminal hydrolase 25/28